MSRINFFHISTVLLWGFKHGSGNISRSFAKVNTNPFLPCFQVQLYEFLEIAVYRKKKVIFLKHLRFYLKACYLYFALLWRAWSNQSSHLLLSATKKHPSKQVVPQNNAAALIMHIHHLSYYRPLHSASPTHRKALLFPTQKVGEETS